MAPNLVTIDCINSAQCKGRIECQVTQTLECAPGGQEATMLDVQRLRQTCSCEFSKDEKEVLWERARLEFDR